MSQTISKKIYHTIDKERIIEALESGNKSEAAVLFKYSVLTKDEFFELQQKHTYCGVFDKQMKEYIKKKEQEMNEKSKEKDIAKIERAFKEHHDEAAEFLFEYSDLTQEEYDEIKRKWRVPKEVKETDENSIWQQVLTEVEKRISRPSYETWFRPLKATVIEGKIIIKCENEFQKDWLEGRYEKLISEIVEEKLGEKYILQFVGDDKK